MPYLTLSDGCEIFYRAKGDPDLGHALFVHPFMHDDTIWLDQVNGLSDIRRCVAIDMRGHGRSDPMTSEAMIDSEYIADLSEIIAALPGKVDLVGLAYGGNLCALLTEALPDRIRSLTMISSGFGGIQDEAEVAALKRYSWEWGRLAVMQGKDVVFRRAMDYILGPDAPIHAKARFRGIIERTPTETYVAFYANSKATPRPDLPGKLHVPVLVPYGGKDPGVDFGGPLGAIRDLHKYRIEGASRLLPLEAPDELNSAIRTFWTELS